MKVFLAGLAFAEKSFDNERLMIDNNGPERLLNRSDCKIGNAEVYSLAKNRVKVECKKGYFLFNKNQKIKKMTYTRDHLDLYKKKDPAAIGSLRQLRCHESKCTKKPPVHDCTATTDVLEVMGLIGGGMIPKFDTVPMDKSNISFPTGFAMVKSTGQTAWPQTVQCYENSQCAVMCMKEPGHTVILAKKMDTTTTTTTTTTKARRAPRSARRAVHDCTATTDVLEMMGVTGGGMIPKFDTVPMDKSNISFPTGFAMVKSTGQKAWAQTVQCYENSLCVVTCMKEQDNSVIVAQKMKNCKVDNGRCIPKKKMRVGNFGKYKVKVKCDSSYEFSRDGKHKSRVQMTYDGKSFMHKSRKGYKRYSASNICKPVSP